MENPFLIKKIQSSYILKNIFNYIKDTNLKMKLFFYSKLFQKILDIKLIDYKEKYIDSIGFDFRKYLHSEQGKNKADILIKKYDNFLLEKNLNKKEFEKIISEVIKNKEIKKKEDSEILIDMESPLFGIISKTKSFENNYTIYISQKNIDENKLKDFYKKHFDNLNKSNIKYSSIYYEFDDKKKINYLKELNIDFNKIKSISMTPKDYEESEEEGKRENKENDTIKYYESLLKFEN